MGSTNIDEYDAAEKRFMTGGKVYVNATATLAHFAARMEELSIKPILCAWTIPFLRTIDAFVHAGLLKEPLMTEFVLTEGGLYGGHPGSSRGLDAFLDFVPARLRMEWSVMCKYGNLMPVAQTALERGGHVSIGLGDYPYEELGYPKNSSLVEKIVRMARSVGREPATPHEVREMLAMREG